MCALAALACSLAVLAGCSTETKQKWLTTFFDGVPPLGSTNAPATRIAPQTQSVNATNVVSKINPSSPLPRPALDIHPPYAQRDCTACHESEFSQKMRGKPGEVCFSCHKNFVTPMKVKHQP